jgi:hypothetical protein
VAFPKTITDPGELCGLRLAAEYETGITLLVGSASATQIDDTNYRLKCRRYHTHEELDFEMEYVSDTCPDTGEEADVYEVVCIQERDDVTESEQNHLDSRGER